MRGRKRENEGMKKEKEEEGEIERIGPGRVRSMTQEWPSLNRERGAAQMRLKAKFTMRF